MNLRDNARRKRGIEYIPLVLSRADEAIEKVSKVVRDIGAKRKRGRLLHTLEASLLVLTPAGLAMVPPTPSFSLALESPTGIYLTVSRWLTQQ